MRVKIFYYDEMLNKSFSHLNITILITESTKFLFHVAQILHFVGYFRRFDYGETGNLRKYKSPIPPNYNVSAITAPVALYWSQNDLFAAVVVSIANKDLY